MSEPGALSLLLHAHLPYVRHPEHADFLEEDWLYEAIAETYVPLLDLLTRLAEEGLPYQLALTLSPTLCEMLADPMLAERASQRLGGLVELSERLARDLRGGPLGPAAEHQARQLAQTWRSYELRWGRRLLPAFAAVAAAGHIEVLASAATHGLLPLLATQPGRRAQITLGIGALKRHLGYAPAGFWLPECAWDAQLDPLLAQAGVRWVALEAHALRGARWARTPAGVLAFARDPASSAEVWSARGGYPGDPAYREFYRDVGFDLPLEVVGPFLHRDGVRRALGIKLHRVTGEVSLGEKQPYDPMAARARAKVHACDFVGKRFAALGQDNRGPLLAPYDAELFGHWWAEGPWFLEFLLREAADRGLPLRTPSTFVETTASLPCEMPARSSWGEGGHFAVWLNPKNDWMLRPLHAAEERMVALAGRFAGASGLRGQALAQAGRELLLAQSSDWPFILTFDTATGYATARVREHLARFGALAAGVESGTFTGAADPVASPWRDFLPDLNPTAWSPHNHD